MLRWLKKLNIPTSADALPGRQTPMPIPSSHYVNGHPIIGPFAESLAEVDLGLGCFWGAERKFWQLDGVYTTAVGYAAGHTPNPTYKEVCSGLTGHNEVVKVVYDPTRISFEALLKTFFESHDPTQGMRQGNDVGTQYRSGIYVYGDPDRAVAAATAAEYGRVLTEAGHGPITTEIRGAGPFYYAEEYHQQYLAKNPLGYCGLGGTGVSCPIGLAATQSTD